MVLIQHREYIGDITSSATPGDLKISKYSINPGLSTTFPWLNILANSFEEYVFTGLVFYFVSSTATDTTIAQLQNSYGTIRGVSYKDLACQVNTASLSVNHLRTRMGAPPTASDLRMYDHGFLEFATSGQQGAATNLGQLWVAYDVHLVKPRVQLGFNF